MRVKTLISSFFLPVLLIGMVQAEPIINSQEYKVLLEPTRFTGNENKVKTQANEFLIDFSAELKKQGLTADVDKTFIADKVRTVSFYDTPGTCKLKSENYVARERTQVKSGKREVMIKRRTDTLAELEGINLTGSYPEASTKVEADIIPGKVVYSISTKQTVGNENIDSIAALDKLFPGLQQNFKQTGELAKVSGLTVTDRSFGGPEVKLGDQQFDFDISIWYVNDDARPVIVELSYKITELTGQFSSVSVQNADKIMNTIFGMRKWALPKSLMKTAWVYHYQPDFCN
ncbi:hypothetical protein [Serratia fonticola]